MPPEHCKQNYPLSTICLFSQLLTLLVRNHHFGKSEHCVKADLNSKSILFHWCVYGMTQSQSKVRISKFRRKLWACQFSKHKDSLSLDLGILLTTTGFLLGWHAAAICLTSSNLIDRNPSNSYYHNSLMITVLQVFKLLQVPR